MDKKVSIIVPIYNIEKVILDKCVNSLMNQTYKKIEIILVDDGSCEECANLCNQYSENDDRIVVIHQKNTGLAGARNTGFKKATGEWITFVDGDDWLSENCIEIIINESMKYNQVQMIMFGIVRETNSKATEYTYFYNDGEVFLEKDCRNLLKDVLNFKCNISTAYAKLIDREFLKKNNILHDEVLKQGAEGIEFNVRLMNKLQKAVFIKKCLYHYRYVENSISQSHNEANHQMVLNCFNKIKEYVENNVEDNTEIVQMLYNRLLYVIITTAITGYFSQKNKEKFKIKKEKYKKYLQNDILIEALKYGRIPEGDYQRKIIINLIKRKQFYLLSLFSKIRYMQKKRRN